MNVSDKLDKVDLQILRTLQDNARLLNKDIAFEFTRIIQEIPEVTECYNISGDYDYLLKIHAPNMKYYQEFILNVLGTIDSLGSLRSTFVMDEVKHDYGIHI